MFDKEQLDKIIKDVIPNTLPDNRKSVIVGTIDKNGISVVAKFDKNAATGNWELDFAVNRDWNDKLSIGSKVIWSF